MSYEPITRQGKSKPLTKRQHLSLSQRRVQAAVEIQQRLIDFDSIEWITDSYAVIHAGSWKTPKLSTAPLQTGGASFCFTDDPDGEGVEISLSLSYTHSTPKWRCRVPFLVLAILMFLILLISLLCYTQKLPLSLQGLCTRPRLPN